MNKRLLYQIVCVAVIILLGILVIMIKKSVSPKLEPGNSITTPSVSETPTQLEISTDPNFVELKGRLIEGFPDFPVYPGAILVASAKISRDDVTNQGFRAKWTFTGSSVPKVMEWYRVALLKNSWTYENNDDVASLGEQRALISNKTYSGFVSAEAENEAKNVDIEVDIRFD